MDTTDSDMQLRVEALHLAVNSNSAGSDEQQVTAAEAYYRFLKGETK